MYLYERSGPPGIWGRGIEPSFEGLGAAPSFVVLSIQNVGHEGESKTFDEVEVKKALAKTADAIINVVAPVEKIAGGFSQATWKVARKDAEAAVSGGSKTLLVGALALGGFGLGAWLLGRRKR